MSRDAMPRGEPVPRWRSLVDAASAPYRAGGRFAWHAARGKLRWDPVFRHLLEAGHITPHARLLDIGCGRGLLASLLGAAGAAAARGDWPAGWAPAPVGVRVTGIDLQAGDIDRARAALGPGARFICADMRTAALPATDEIVILDALHYVSLAEQDQVLARARAALVDGGRLVLRVGDAAARRGFASSLWVDRIVSTLGRRARPQRGRTRAAWTARLVELGFRVSSWPMRAGTPFANVLFVARVETASPSP